MCYISISNWLAVHCHNPSTSWQWMRFMADPESTRVETLWLSLVKCSCTGSVRLRGQKGGYAGHDAPLRGLLLYPAATGSGGLDVGWLVRSRLYRWMVRVMYWLNGWSSLLYGLSQPAVWGLIHHWKWLAERCHSSHFVQHMSWILQHNRSLILNPGTDEATELICWYWAASCWVLKEFVNEQWEVWKRSVHLNVLVTKRLI